MRPVSNPHEDRAADSLRDIYRQARHASEIIKAGGMDMLSLTAFIFCAWLVVVGGVLVIGGGV